MAVSLFVARCSLFVVRRSLLVVPAASPPPPLKQLEHLEHLEIHNIKKAMRHGSVTPSVRKLTDYIYKL